MHNELTDRQAAIRRRLAGESIAAICQSMHRSEAWFHPVVCHLPQRPGAFGCTGNRRASGKWWQRYLTEGPEGLYDLTRANQQVVNRTPPHIDRAVISIRRRLAGHATPQTHYSLVGATTIRAELKALGQTPLPALRTTPAPTAKQVRVEAIVARAGLTCPPLRLARRLAQSDYPGLVARDSNELHQVDVVGPRHLFGRSTDYYFLICRDVFDPHLLRSWGRCGADYLE